MSKLSGIKSNLPFLGFAFYWAWVTVVFYSDALAPDLPDSKELIETVWLWATWSHMVVLFVLAALERHMPSLFSTALFRCIGAMGSTVGTVAIPVMLFLLGSESTLCMLLVLGSSVLVGASSAWHVLQWSELYGELPADSIMGPSLLSFAGGLLIYFVVMAFPPVIATAMAAIFPLLSLLSMTVAARSSTTDPASSHGTGISQDSPTAPALRGLMLPIIAVFACALCGEMLRVFSLQLAETSVSGMGMLYLFGGLLGLAALAAYAFAPGDANVRRITLPLLRTVLLLMAAAFLLAPFFSGYSFAVSYGIFGAGFWCFRAVTWVFCLLLSARVRWRAIAAIGVLDGVFALSVVVSAQLNSWLAEAIKVGTTELTTVALIAVFVLMFIVVFVLNGREVKAILDPPERMIPKSEDRVADREGNVAACVELLSQRYGLSPRESEVAALLAKGRSLPFIQGELYISAGTAQTHARHIYKKLGVHSRPEFLDVIERSLEEL